MVSTREFVLRGPLEWDTPVYSTAIAQFDQAVPYAGMPGCDILVLAAREDQITSANAYGLQCRMIAEGANGPTSLEADAILRERGVPIPPGIGDVGEALQGRGLYP